MKRNRILILIMAFMLALLLVSCGSSNEKPDDTESDIDTDSDTNVIDNNDSDDNQNDNKDDGSDTSTNTGNGLACRHATPVPIPAVSPTCEEYGWTEGLRCEDCGNVIREPEQIEKSHVEAVYAGVAPTCTAEGLSDGVYCSVCYEVIVQRVPMEKASHYEISYQEVKANCKRVGYTGGSYCGVCTEVIEERTVIPKTGHTSVAYEDVAPTCTENGYTGGTYCSVCDTVTEERTVVLTTGHSIVNYPEVEPTCVAVGYTGGTYCSACSEVITERTVLEQENHIVVAREDVAPTCVTVGFTGGTHCSECGEGFIAATIIPALGHTETVTMGSTPTCSSTGMSDGKYCTTCKTTTLEQVVLEKLNHAEVITKAIAPTCQSVGYSEKRQCSVCKEITLASVEIPKSGHTVVVDKAVSATCSGTGLTEGSHCSVCSTVIVAQEVIAKNSNHVYPEFAKVTKTPTSSSTGSGSLTCTECGSVQNITFEKLSLSQLTADDIYSIETDIYNPAYDNRWKIFNGNKNVSDLWSSGDDWFGNVGDVLVISLKQEMMLSGLTIYTAGNDTYAKVRVKDSAGNKTFEKTVKANGSAYGGTPETQILTSNNNIKAYTIEIEITSLKWNSANTFKVSELEITAAPQDSRIQHTHNYREFIENSRVATCQVTGIDVYECFCGRRSEVELPKVEHEYSTLKSELKSTCTTDGIAVYECDCGETITEQTTATGHIFHKLLNYSIQPTASTSGVAIYKCNGCNLRQEKIVSPLQIEDIYYLRVDKIEDGMVTLKLNVYGERPSLDVRYSTSEITEASFFDATIVEATVKGTSLVTITIPLDASLENGYYVAIRPYSGSNYGEMLTVRVGGDSEIPIDYDKAQVYHGEVLNSFKKMFDNDITTQLALIFSATDENTAELYGSSLAPIVDLEYMHYVTKFSLYYADAGKNATVRWSDTPLDFQSDNSLWDGYEVITSAQGWNDIAINASTRYIQIIFTDGEAPYEVEAYGYQCGDGDEIATERRELATIGEMMGMCGFVASGGGNTPVDSVSSVTVLREYHNFGWSYDATKYGKQAAMFTSTWMGNFDSQYQIYKDARINVIPCIQWSLGNGETISYKVGLNKLPLYSNGELIRASFWERFDPHTYFVYADSIFAFAARYGSNSSSELLEIAKIHCSDVSSVGQGTIEWIEMGNEPEGNWNGIHNYLSAYQLAAATSAAYDGHCKTMLTSSKGGYHLGGKNADPNIKLAMAGVSGVSNEYITAFCYWMKANRLDSSTAFDAFNVHNYMSKQITLPNGATAYVGISPEEAKITETLSQLLAIRDQYYPEKEVWITEFGWDTNQSYATATSSHAYGEYTGRQVQAMWLTRTYLLLSAIGIDKADMYMCEDTGVEEESVGKYGSSGVIAFEYNENGEKVEVKKDSYYYLYTLKNTLGSYTFDSQVEAYDENVLIYKYKTEDGKTAYALWCKTSDGTKADNYQLAIDGDTATLVEAVYGDIDGVKSDLSADQYGYVSVNVSENPVYVIVD